MSRLNILLLEVADQRLVGAALLVSVHDFIFEEFIVQLEIGFLVLDN